MTAFDPILEAATARVGGTDALAARLPEVKSADELRVVPDDRYLSLIALRIFRAGLKHSLVDAKWPHFENAFGGFHPRRVRAMTDEQLEKLLADRRLIRHWGKMKAVRTNAAAVCALEEETGGVGPYLADWPGNRITGLWDDLGRRFAHMGGKSGPYFLRMAGKDTFLLTEAVARALQRWDAFHATPKSKADRDKVQAIFNDWAAATGRPLAHLSMILALSAD